MNEDERTPGQGAQGDMADRGLGGSASTGQASYGNSGETETETLNQDKDVGHTGRSTELSDGSESAFFGGSGDDMGSAGTGRSGIPGSIDKTNQSSDELGASTGRSGIEGSLGNTENGDQNFASQGQGAMSQDAMGSADKAGTTDIETERSQGRESDIEGSSL